ncbi:MAG: EamA family transporter [Rubritepida sp.]|nr:EamA family transporter [Rubritepida sp.]
MPLQHLLPPLIVVLLWTGNNLVTKLSAGSVDPRVMGFGRFAIALLVLAPLAYRQGWAYRAVIRRNLPKLAFLGFLGMGLAQGIPYFAARTVTATTIGILVAFIPLVTLALSGVLLREKPRWTTVIGGIVSLVGVGFLLGHGDISTLASQGIGIGEGLMLTSVLAYAAYGVFLKFWSLPIPIWPSLFVQSCFAALMLLPAYLATPPLEITTGGIAIVLYAGVVASAMAPFLWMRGIATIGPSRMASFSNLVPVLTAAAAVAFLGEPLQAYHVYSGGIILMGVALAQWGSRRRSA